MNELVGCAEKHANVNVIDLVDSGDSLYTFDSSGICVQALHLSCSSTQTANWYKNLAGVVFYDNATINGIRMRPGYVYIRAVDEIQSVSSNEGQVHGKLVRSLLGYEPAQLNMRVSGFARVNGEWRFNSYALNTGHIDQDGVKKMNAVEVYYLEQALLKWENGARQNLFPKDFIRFSMNRQSTSTDPFKD
eukprot:TRINITY_DN30358_c0_g1_i1.p2 TRINITY_DN30358_c0_g1~~TRINITY_DN30358_c0_g1_i1.p2  ORF type:complete len:190 (+),score=7.50 TRINITY_DN30358_c0_g1_i1:272-841(+)